MTVLSVNPSLDYCCDMHVQTTVCVNVDNDTAMNILNVCIVHV